MTSCSVSVSLRGGGSILFATERRNLANRIELSQAERLVPRAQVWLIKEVGGKGRSGSQYLDVVFHDMSEYPLASVREYFLNEREDILLANAIGCNEQEEERTEPVPALDALFQEL